MPKTSNTPSVFLSDPDVTLYHGDVLATLRELPAESVDCVVTSPPYWGLRDYGSEGQIGLEPTPEQYVERMVEVFREMRRVLAAHGTLWLNLGDSYHGGGGYAPNAPSNLARAAGERVGKFHGERRATSMARVKPKRDYLDSCPCEDGGPCEREVELKPKDLVGIPWRVAFALQADGWYLRSDIIWAKPNPMPESVTDRPTKAHEYLFLLSKNARYHFDQEAVREPAEWQRWGDQTTPKHNGTSTAAGWIKPKGKQELLGEQQAKLRGGDTKSGFNERWFNGEEKALGRNIRSVWEIATQPYPEAHFATFPEELARRCIAAGCPEHGIVLDPFIGSGTVAYVARKLGRRSIGIDLSAEYLALAAKRLQQQSLFAEVAS